MLTGKNLIAGTWAESTESFDSADLQGQKFARADAGQVKAACQAAKACLRDYRQMPRSKRACFLRTIAEQIDILGDAITETAMLETRLPEARLTGERGRTTGQLRLFADVIEDVEFLDIRHDAALPDRAPLPRPDLRLSHRAIGVVAVFGASNFPLAFSTAGGDTASALAAGCPVIVKGHEGHPGVAELVARAIAQAIEICQMPKAVFQLLQGDGHALGTALVQDENISAVGFTGSLAGGRALYDLCHARPVPIPFYGELGSINPMFCLPEAVAARGAEMGAGWAASLTMGAGQFCTNPGVAVVLKDSAAFEQACAQALQQAAPQPMLTKNIRNAYIRGVEALQSEGAVAIVSPQNLDQPHHSAPALFKVSAQQWRENPALHEEVFGASGILVECESFAEMLDVAENLAGQLTATLHMDEGDTESAQALLPILEEKVGRVLCNGFPTGVEVCSAMMHGGVYPASTDSRSTSVGTLAIARWLCPISYQNVPQMLLPEELRG